MSKEIGKLIDAYISKRFTEAERLGWTHLILRSGQLHSDLQLRNRFPSCCQAMRRAMVDDHDAQLDAPPSGNGAILTILYRLPRPETGETVPLETLFERIKKAALGKRGLINLKGGSSTKLVSLTKGAIKYQRGKSVLSLKFEVLHNTLEFIRRRGSAGVTTSELRRIFPEIFSQRARPCNCTFLLQLLHLAGLVEVSGEGKRGNPFKATILSEPSGSVILTECQQTSKLVL
jgi:hypothetical protein